MLEVEREEGWMPAGLRVLKTQVNAAVFFFSFCLMHIELKEISLRYREGALKW